MFAPRQFIQTIRQWNQRSLANSFALRAASIALISVLVIAAVSVVTLYWTERHASEAELNSKAGNAAVSVRLSHLPTPSEADQAHCFFEGGSDEETARDGLLA